MHKVTLSSDHINFEPSSRVDNFGRLFWYENKIYRGVAREFNPLAMEILKRIPKWTEYGLIETTEAGFNMEIYPLVLAHRTVRFRSYCTEWTPEMLKDAALTYLNLQLKLMEEDYVLKDGHPWNILFDKGRPVYIDIGSISPYSLSNLQRALNDFRYYFYLPLYMFKKCGSEKTYGLLQRSIPNTPEREKIACQIGVKPIHISKLPGPRYGLKRIIRKIEKLKFSKITLTEWSKYEQRTPDISEPNLFVEKELAVYKVLKRQRAGTLLDIGCNKGWYSMLAESLGFEVMSVDIDLQSLAILYEQVKREQRKILPLHVDICQPTGANGLDKTYPSFMERGKSDVVLAMAVTHHLGYKRKFSFEDLARFIAQLAGKVAIVEFIPRDDLHVKKWNQQGMDWYTRQNFVDAFMHHFNRLEIFPSTPSPREVFVFEKQYS